MRPDSNEEVFNMKQIPIILLISPHNKMCDTKN